MTGRRRALIACVGLILAAALAILLWPSGAAPPITTIEGRPDPRRVGGVGSLPQQPDDARPPANQPLVARGLDGPTGPTVVYGVVANRATGRPLPEAHVSLLGGRESFEGPPPVLGHAITDGSGEYRMEIRWLDERAFGFAVERQGMAQALVGLSAPQLWPGTTHRQDLAVDVLPTVRDFPVTARAKWARGNLAPGVQIRATWQGADRDGSTAGTTGPNGEFSFVAAGVVQNGWIRVTASGRSGHEVTANWGAPSRLTELIWDFVLPDDTGSLEVVMVDRSGRPLSMPVSYKLLGYIGNESPGIQAPMLDLPRTTDAHGVDRVQLPTPAHYQVHGLRAPGWRQDLRASAAMGRLALAPGATETLAVRCEPVRLLSVRVLGPSGGIPGARVSADLGTESDVGRTDNGGHVVLRLPTHRGRLRVSAESLDHRVGWREIPIDDEGPLPEVVLRAEPLASASVIVELAPRAEPLPLGTPIGVAVYRLPRAPGDGPIVSRHILSHCVHVGRLVEGAQYDVILGAMTAEPIWVRGVTASTEPVPVRVGPLGLVTTACRGAVVRPDGGPVPEPAGIHIFGMPGTESDGLTWAGTTTDGRFDCPCSPGLYRVQLAHEDWEGWVDNISVPGPDVAIHARPQTIERDPFQMSIKLEIVDVATGEGVPDAQVELTDLNAPPPAVVEDADRPDFFAHTISDAQGRAFCDMWGKPTAFRARVRAPGYAEAEARIEPPYAVTRIELRRE